MLTNSECKIPTQTEWEYMLQRQIIVQGDRDEALYRRAVRLFTKKGGIAQDCLESMTWPPKMYVYKSATLPEGIKAFYEDGALNIAFGLHSDEAILKNMKQAYASLKLVSNDQTDLLSSERSSEGVSTHVTDQTRIDKERGDDRSNGRNYAKERKYGDFYPDEALALRGRFFNTGGHVHDWKEDYEDHLRLKALHPDKATLWQWYQKRMFSDEIMQHFSGKVDHTKAKGTVIKDYPLWKAWLRGLRVMSGVSTLDIARSLSMPQPTYSTTIENSPAKIQPHIVHRILENNIFHFPEIEADGRKTIDPAYILKFLDMCECGREGIITHEQLFPAVKAVAKAYLRGQVTIEQMPVLNEVLAFLSDDPVHKFVYTRAGNPALVGRIKSGHIPYQHMSKFQDLLTFDGKDYTEYFAVLPHYESVSRKVLPSIALSHDQAFELASNTAANIPEFIKIYIKSTHQGLQEIADRSGTSAESVRLYTIGEKITPKRLEKILDIKNIFRLPADKDGNIKPEVMEHLKGLCAKGLQNGQYKTSKLYNVEAYEYAKNKATTASELLKFYVQATHQSISQISSRTGRGKYVISKILKENYFDDSRLEFIFGMSNPFALPIDKHGKIQSGVVAFIKELNSEFLEQWCQDTADEISWAKRFAAQNKKPFLTKGGQSVTGNDASSDSIAEEEMRPERSYTSVARLKDDKGQTPIR